MRPAAADASGTVVDQSGRAVPRAYVRMLDPSGTETAGVFADEIGRFELTAAGSDCRVEARLTGFQPASVPCASRWEASRQPRHSGFAGVTLSWQRVSADLNGVFIGTFVDSDFGLFNRPLVENPGHNTWDARLPLRRTSPITGTLSIDNLTDQVYSEPFGYQALRRTVGAGVRMAF